MHIGVDLGGTKIEVLLINQQGQELLRKRVATPKGDYQATLRAIQSLVLEAEQQAGQEYVKGMSLFSCADLVSLTN